MNAKERPILMSAPMIQAYQAGLKTQTRRTRGLQFFNDQPDAFRLVELDGWLAVFERNGKRYSTKSPYGAPGDRLVFRERHCYLDVTKSASSQFPLGDDKFGPDVWNVVIEYGDGTERDTSVEGERPKQTRERGETGWRPGIHMHRWAARYAPLVTGVRVERLQDINYSDAMAEGVRLVDGKNYIGNGLILEYHELWKSLNGAESWALNPWVWVIEFERNKQ